MTSPLLEAIWSEAAKNRHSEAIFDWDAKSKKFKSITWGEYCDQIAGVMKSLSELNLRPNTPVLLMLTNSIHWDLVEKACFGLNLQIVAAETHLAAQRINDIIAITKPEIAFIESEDIAKKIDPEVLSGIKFKCIKNSFANDTRPENLLWSDIFKISSNSLSLPELTGANISSRDLTSYVLFTSGTTGVPKVLTYTQSQIFEAVTTLLNHEGGWGKNQRVLSWLPMANPFQRMTNLCALLSESKLFIYSPPTEVLTGLKKVRPTIFIGIPRFYEKLYLSLSSFHRKLDFLPKKFQSVILKIVMRRFFSKKAKLISGSAALKLQVLEFFENLNYPILEAYGLTECILPVAMNTPSTKRSGSVGKPVLKNMVSFSDKNEICLKSNFIANQFSQNDQGLSTGDIGFLDRDGFLHLKERESRIIKLSTGRKIFRTEIENKFSFDENIDHFLIFGNERPFLVGVVTLQKGFSASESWIKSLYEYIDSFNSKLSEYEKVRQLIILSRPLSIENNELTHNLKVRYQNIETNIKEELEQAWMKKSS